MVTATATAEPRTAKPRTATPPAAQAQTAAWKQQSVGEFFARCNWENLELPALEAKLPGQAVALDYSLSVAQFFGAIPWEGGAMQSTMATQASPGMAQANPALERPSLDDDSAMEELPDLDEIADESHLNGGDVTLDDFLGSFSV